MRNRRKSIKLYKYIMKLEAFLETLEEYLEAFYKVQIVHISHEHGVSGVSLNIYLYTGSDLIANLPSILFKFREHKVAVEIVIDDEDRDSQRCL